MIDRQEVNDLATPKKHNPKPAIRKSEHPRIYILK